MKDLTSLKRASNLMGQNPFLGTVLFLFSLSVSVCLLYFYLASTEHRFSSLNSLLNHYETKEKFSTRLQKYDQRLTSYTANFLYTDSEKQKKEIKAKYDDLKGEVTDFLSQKENKITEDSTKEILKSLIKQNEELTKIETKVFRGEQNTLGEQYLNHKSAFSKSLIDLSQDLSIAPEKKKEIVSFFSKYDGKRKELIFFLLGFWVIFSAVFYYVNYLRSRILKEFNSQNRFLETLINQIQSGVVAVNRKGEVTHWNKAATDIVGEPGTDSPFEFWPEFFGVFKAEEKKETLKYEELPLYKALQGERVLDEELVIKKADENLVISCFATPLYDEGSEGDIHGAVVIFSDVTSQKNLEEERQKSFHASKMATLGEVSGNLAHEINTPLCTVKLSSELIHLGIKQGDMSKVKKFIGTIDSAIERMASIVDGFRKYSRQEQMKPEFEIVSLTSCIEESLKLCSIDFSHREIKVIRNFDDTEHFLCECAPTLMVQLFVNLLVNAKDAISDLEERWVEISIREKNGKAIVEFKDSGTGVEEEVVQQMFNPFFSTKDFGKGTGMGLGMVKNIAQTHRGSVYYKLKGGHTCFVYEMDLFYGKKLSEAS